MLKKDLSEESIGGGPSICVNSIPAHTIPDADSLFLGGQSYPLSCWQRIFARICGCLLPEDDCSPMLKKPVGAARKHNTQLAKHRKAQRGRPTLDQIKITALMQPTTIEEDDAGGSDEGGNSDDEIGNRQVSKCVAASDNSL